MTDTASRIRALAEDIASAEGHAGPDAALRGLKLIHEAVGDLADTMAAELGHAGMSYGDLGNAWGITRQGARRRWPSAVPVREKPTPCEHCNGTGHT